MVTNVSKAHNLDKPSNRRLNRGSDLNTSKESDEFHQNHSSSKYLKKARIEAGGMTQDNFYKVPNQPSQESSPWKAGGISGSDI